MHRVRARILSVKRASSSGSYMRLSNPNFLHRLLCSIDWRKEVNLPSKDIIYKTDTFCSIASVCPLTSPLILLYLECATESLLVQQKQAVSIRRPIEISELEILW